MPDGKLLGAIALSALLLAAGCGDKTKSEANATNVTAPAADGNATADAGNEAAPAVDATADPYGVNGTTADTPVKQAIAARNGVTRYAPKDGSAGAGPAQSAPPARPGGYLAKYADLRPREVENGRSFLGEPVVRKAVAANVRDARVRDFIFNYSGPDAPIAAKNGRLLAWGCEANNCGFRNWAVSIRPDGSGAEICYYRDSERPDGSATWYLPGGRTVKRAGNCPDE